MKISITPFWDKRVMDTKTKESRVMLIINLNRKQKMVTLKIRATKEDFDKAIGGRSLNEDQKQLRKQINDYVAKAEMIFDKLPQCTFDSFIRLFKSETDLITSSKTDVFYFYCLKRDEALKENRVSTANNYSDCLRALKKYKSSVYFEDVDEKWLKSYKQYMIELGNSDSTISIRLRCLRTMFNYAIGEGFISEKLYPFKKFSVSCAAKSKAVLYEHELQKLWEYKPIGIMQSRAKAYFFMLYLCNGMNFADLCNLKWKNIKGDYLTFIRQKTKNTISTPKEIRVYLMDEIKAIINEWGNDKKKPDDYVFPIYSKCKNAKHMEVTKIRIKRVCNMKLNDIAESVGIKTHISLSLARHSFATKLKLDGMPISFIGDSLGHTNSKTTEHYVKSLPDENLKKISKSLLSFKKAV